MDEDEFMRFISGPGSYCPYFDPYDEYKIVSRQNRCTLLFSLFPPYDEYKIVSRQN